MWFLDSPNRRSLEVVFVRNVRMIPGWKPNKSLERWRYMKHPTAKFKSEKCRQWNTPHQNSFRLYLEKNHFNQLSKINADWSGHLEQIQRLQSMPLNIICFFRERKILIKRNPLPHPIYRGPPTDICALTNRAWKESTSKTHLKSLYDLQILGHPQNESLDPTIQKLHSFKLRKKLIMVQNQPQGKRQETRQWSENFRWLVFFHFFSGPHLWWGYLFFGGGRN